MAKKRPHEIAEEHQKQYEREVRLQYDPALVKQSQERWGSYTASQKDFVIEEGGRIQMAIVAAMEAGKPVEDAEVQEGVARWHQHLRYFYEPTLEVLRGLGELYTTDERFMAFFAKIHPNLATYLKQAIDVYVDELETAEIQAMLDEDERVKKLSS
jgi:MerR family transcriptional regulator, thiopeptide resistance regulator